MQIPLSRSAIYCCLNRGTIYCCFGNAYEGKHGPLLRQRVKGSSSHRSAWLPNLDFGRGMFTLKMLGCALINSNSICTEPCGSLCPLLDP